MGDLESRRAGEIADVEMKPPEVADESVSRPAAAPDAVDPHEQEKYAGNKYQRRECDAQFLAKYGHRFLFQCIEMQENRSGSVEFTHEHVELQLYPEGYVSTDDQDSGKHGNWRARSEGDCLIIEFRSVKSNPTKYPYTFLRVGPEAGTWISNNDGPFQAILMIKA